MNTKLLFPVLLVCAFVAGCGDPSGEQIHVSNTSLALANIDPEHVVAAGDVVVVLVSESAQGGNDLNGDGDQADNVVHLIDAATGATTNLGISGKPPLVSNGQYVAWAVEERMEGRQDLNGDTDTADHVLAIVDTLAPLGPGNPRVTDVTLEPQLPFEATGNWFGFVTSELSLREVSSIVFFGPGLTTDLNGDGDELDYVARFFNAADPSDTTALVNSGLAFDNNETVEVIDFDPHEYDEAVATYTVSFTEITPNAPASSGQPGVTYEIFPNLSALGLAFNTSTGVISGIPTTGSDGPRLFRVLVTGGAGGTTDVVITVNSAGSGDPHAYNEPTPVYNLFEEITPNFPAPPGSGLTYSIQRSFPPLGPGFTTSTGLDFDTGTGAITGTPTSISPKTEWLITASGPGGGTTTVVVEVEPPEQEDAVVRVLEAGRGIFVFSVNESADGAELNLDDDARDTVLYFFDTNDLVSGSQAVGEPAPRALDESSEVVIGGTVAAPVIGYAFSEEFEGGLSANIFPTFGDTDVDDFILVLFDVATGNEILPDGGVGVDPTQIVGGDVRFAFVALEEDNGSGLVSDFNQDGDALDDVPHWIDLTDPTVAYSSGLASVPTLCSLSVSGEYMVFVASEIDQGRFGTNFNAVAQDIIKIDNDAVPDIDLDDGVAHFFDLSTPGIEPVNLQIATAQVVAYPGYFWIIGDEDSQSGDLNGVNVGRNELVPLYYRVVGSSLASGPAPLGLSGIFYKEYLRSQTSPVVPTTGEDVIGLFVIEDRPNQIRVHINVSETVVANPQNRPDRTLDINADGDLDDWIYYTYLVNRNDGSTERSNYLGISTGTGELLEADQTVDTSPWPVVLPSVQAAVFSYDEAADGTGENRNASTGDIDNVDSVANVLQVR